ncbi:MAG TPA: hypothetical protein VFM93_09165, partial [Candidatus Limnocylindria bacterium]|nr:hypothetical protein [Candidatus Limnocylindria bacterium]
IAAFASLTVAAALGLMALRAPSLELFCERSGGLPDICQIPLASALFSSLWPGMLGIALGALAGRYAPTRGPGTHALMLGASAPAIGSWATRLVAAPLGGDPPAAPIPEAAWLALAAASAAVFGAFVGSRTRTPLRDGAAIALVYAMPAAATALAAARDPRAAEAVLAQPAWVVPFAVALVAALALVQSALFARSRRAR